MNGLIYILCKIMKNVVASPAQAEFGTIFLKGKESVLIRKTFEVIKCSQPPRPVKVNNSTATGIAKRKIYQKCQTQLT